MKFYIFLLCLLFCLSFDGSAANKKKEVPQWVTERISDPYYYVGIGYAQKQKKSLTYYETASKAALVALAEDISLTVNSSTLMVGFETDEKTRDDLSSIIKVRAQNDLTGYEKVDVYEDKDNYWVYYRLSKTLYKEREEQKKQAAATLANEHVRSGNEAMKLTDYKMAIIYYAQAIDAVKGYLNEVIALENSQENLVHYAYQQIYFILDSIQLKASSSLNAVYGKEFSGECTIMYANKHSIKNFPISVKFSGGALASGSGISTGSGNLTCSVNAVQSKKESETLTFSVNKDAVFIESGVDFIIRSWLLQIPAKTVTTEIKIRKPKVCIISEEKNIGKGIQPQILPALRQLFEQSNYKIIESRNAECTISITTNTSTKSLEKGIHTVMLTGTIRILNKDGNAVYTKEITGIKGQQLNESAAGLNAYREAVRLLNVRYFPDLEKAIGKGIN